VRGQPAKPVCQLRYVGASVTSLWQPGTKPLCVSVSANAKLACSARSILLTPDVSRLCEPQVERAMQGVKLNPVVNASGANTLFRQASDQAINGGDYACNATALDKFFRAKRDALNATQLRLARKLYNDYDLKNWPLYAVLLYEGTAGITDMFYPDKQQGTEFAKRLRELDKFWDVHTPNVAVYAMNTLWIARTDLMVPALEYAYGLTTDDARARVAEAQAVFSTYPEIGYDFPLWTLNAFASLRTGTIAIGDGLLRFFDAVDILDAAPDYVLAHEFGHHVEFGLELEEVFGGTPESSRYIELLADSMSAYFSHHPRGASFQTKRLCQVVKAAFATGDCGFSSSGHHGTPNQRERAVLFATNMIDASKAKGQILKAAEFKAKFDAAFPRIVAPDAV
jgi:hypothetical protein